MQTSLKPTFQQILILAGLGVFALYGCLREPVPPSLTLLIGVLCPSPLNAAPASSAGKAP